MCRIEDDVEPLRGQRWKAGRWKQWVIKYGFSIE